MSLFFWSANTGYLYYFLVDVMKTKYFFSNTYNLSICETRETFLSKTFESWLTNIVTTTSKISKYKALWSASADTFLEKMKSGTKF